MTDSLVGNEPVMNDNCCTVWSDRYYEGGWVNICTSSWYWVDLHTLDWDDYNSSYICGTRARMTLCKYENPDSKHGCYKNHGVSGSAGTYARLTGWEDRASSMLVEYEDPVNGTGSVTGFINSDCTWDSAFFEANPNPGEWQPYNFSAMEKNLFIHNDAMTAVMVPVGYTLVVYEHDGFGGNHETIEGKASESG